ncbi:MAG: mechanosensitive ion channel [Lachnospiraceae bacterium]|nr:mechanosensitive ion channel [Lachnospiraceae bacterium]
MTGDYIILSNANISDLSDIAAVERSIFREFADNLKLNSLDFLVRVLITGIVLVAGIYAIRFVTKWFSKMLERSSIEEVNAQLLKNAVKAGLYVLLILLVFAHFGVEAASVIAILGSAGLTLGLAFQGALSNFAGGVLIMITKPFRIGDYIEIESNMAGTVTQIGLVHTKLLTLDNRVVIHPNGDLANSTITNYTDKEKRRIELTIGISYGEDIDRVKEVLKKVIDEEPLLLKDDDVLIYVDSMSASSVDIGVKVYTNTQDYLSAKWALTESIKKALDKNGIEIPYTQMDVHIKQ